jgi:hypothetical protein
MTNSPAVANGETTSAATSQHARLRLVAPAFIQGVTVAVRMSEYAPTRALT